MSTHNIPFSIYILKSAYIVPNLQLLKDEFETAMVNEPSAFESLKVCCSRTTKKRRVHRIFNNYFIAWPRIMEKSDPMDAQAWMTRLSFCCSHMPLDLF